MPRCQHGVYCCIAVACLSKHNPHLFSKPNNDFPPTTMPKPMPAPPPTRRTPPSPTATPPLRSSPLSPRSCHEGSTSVACCASPRRKPLPCHSTKWSQQPTLSGAFVQVGDYRGCCRGLASVLHYLALFWLYLGVTVLFRSTVDSLGCRLALLTSDCNEMQWELLPWSLLLHLNHAPVDEGLPLRACAGVLS